MTVLTHTLDRTVLIRAPRDMVFRYFTDSTRWAAWWGAGSSIDAQPGGLMRIRYPDGTEAVGEVEEVVRPERIVFTYGYASGKTIPPGGSRVTVRLDPHPDGTRVALTHDFSEAAARDHHVQGWRYQLSMFSNVVVDELLAGAADAVDAWFEAWTTASPEVREKALATIVSPAITFRDRFSAIDGVAELHAHIDGALRFMPRVRLRRHGAIRHCQGMVLADWTATGLGPNGEGLANGTNLFVFDAGAKMTSVVGFWN